MCYRYRPFRFTRDGCGACLAAGQRWFSRGGGAGRSGGHYTDARSKTAMRLPALSAVRPVLKIHYLSPVFAFEELLRHALSAPNPSDVRDLHLDSFLYAVGQRIELNRLQRCGARHRRATRGRHVARVCGGCLPATAHEVRPHAFSADVAVAQLCLRVFRPPPDRGVK